MAVLLFKKKEYNRKLSKFQSPKCTQYIIYLEKKSTEFVHEILAGKALFILGNSDDCFDN